MDLDNEWYSLCSKNDVELLHLDNTNDFKITFEVLENFDNICEIIQEHQLFELIFELNKDVLTNYSEIEINNVNKVTFNITSKGLPSFNTFSEAVIYLSYSIKYNKLDDCINLYSHSVNKPSNADNNHIYLVNFGFQVNKQSDSSLVTINYTLDDNINNVSNKFISLHLKNIFYKVKKYFD
jgi:hypothetical protein